MIDEIYQSTSSCKNLAKHAKYTFEKICRYNKLNNCQVYIVAKLHYDISIKVNMYCIKVLTTVSLRQTGTKRYTIDKKLNRYPFVYNPNSGEKTWPLL